MPSEPPPLVLHVIHHLVIGGMENGLVNLVNSMPPSAYRHAIACIDDFSDFRDRITRADVEVVALHRPRDGVWRTRRRLFDLCRKLKPTVVHSRGQSGLDALPPALLAGVPHRVHGEHGWDVDDLDGLAWKPTLLRRLHSPLVGRYVTVSKDIERFLVERVGIASRRISQIYNGVDTRRFAPRGSGPVLELPPELQGDGLVIVGTVGRLQRVKDQATLLRAFARLVDRAPELRARMRLAIVGNGPLMPELRALSTSLGIDPLTWFAGALPNVPDVLRAFDLFVLPSLNEGISNTILEAMASALPVAATAVGGNVELIDDRQTGALFAPGDVDALATLLADYGSDRGLRERHGRAARAVALDRFSLYAMTRNYQALYDGMRVSNLPQAGLA